MKSKNIILSFTLFSLMFFQSCDNTVKLPVGDPIFDMTLLYPNPLSTNDTLTLGIDWNYYDIKYSVLDDFKVIIEKSTKRDTLIIVGLYDKYKPDSLSKMGIFNSEDEKIQTIMFESKITLQCIIDSSHSGYWVASVVNNNFTTKSKIKLLIYKGK